MSDIDEVLRLGVKDVLLKTLNRLEEAEKFSLSHLLSVIFLNGVLEKIMISRDLGSVTT